MAQKVFGWLARSTVLRVLCPIALVWTCAAHGDQVEMQNGDRYVGRVLSLGSDTLVVQSEVLGTLRLPRAKISTITLGAVVAPPVNSPPGVGVVATRSNHLARASMAASTNAAPEFAKALSQLGSNSNVIQKVQEQFLAGAGPEAQAKFNDMMGGLLSGRLSVTDLRAEARSTLEQAKSARKDMGEESGSMIDSYLAILESFLKETEPPAGSVTNSAAAPPKARVESPPEEQ